MSNIVEHAKREFKYLGYVPVDEDQEDDPNKWIQENVLELLKVFSEQGHSGSSAPFCVRYFKKLAMFEPLRPLQGTEDEWCEVHNSTFQNKRCSHVFKENGRAYDIQGIVFTEKNGCSFTGHGSRVTVKFPYVPRTKYVNERLKWFYRLKRRIIEW